MLAIWGIAVVVALILVGTSLHGLTTSVHVVGTTQSSQAEALYRQALGASAGPRPTDVIVVSSKSSAVSDGSFQQLAGPARRPRSGRLSWRHARRHRSERWQPVRLVRPSRGADRAAGRKRRRHKAGGEKHVQAANGSGGFSVAVTGDHTVANDFSTLSASDLKHGELDFGLPISSIGESCCWCSAP